MAAKNGRRFGIPAARIAGFLALSALTGWAQSSGSGQINSPIAQPTQTRPSFGEGPQDEPPPRFADSMKNRRNDDRQKRLTSDSQRLLILASQLKNEVAASGAESMTADMLKQVDEIEHLAHSVKDKMKN